MSKLTLDKAIVVEGRDDVDAVSRAVDALIIPTHGFGIRKETWELIDKAYKEKGLIILTDPDFSGEEIRRKLTERFPDASQAYISQAEATLADDIGVENAKPEVIEAAIRKAIERETLQQENRDFAEVTMSELVMLGLAGTAGADALREKLCAKLGIGYGNSKALLKKLKYWKIGLKEIEQAIKEIEEE